MPAHEQQPIRDAAGVTQAARREWFGPWQPVEPLATAGPLALWRVSGGGGSTALLRLYPRFQRRDDGRFQDAAERRVKRDDHPWILPVAGIGEDRRAQLIFSDPIGEPLATRIEREPLAPEAAALVFADVADGLDALVHGRIAPVDLTVADVYLTGDRGLLLGDAGLLSEVLRGRCPDTTYAAPERVHGAAERGQDGPGLPLTRMARDRARPTSASMSYSFAAVLRAALLGPTADADALAQPIRQFFDRALAEDPGERYRTPKQAIAAFETAIAAAEVVDLKAPRPAPAAKARPARATRSPAPAQADALAGPAAETAGAGPPLAAAGAAAEQAPRRSPRRALGVAAAAVVAAAAGLAVGIATTPSDPPSATTVARDGLRVAIPPGWQRLPATAAPVDAGADAVVARAEADPGAELVVTRSGGKLLESVPSDIDPTAVALRGGDAWRYAGARLGGQRAVVYMLPTTAGPVVAACYGPGGATAARTDCAGAVASLRAGGAEVVPLGGEPAVRERVADALAALTRARADDRRALAGAVRPAGQAAAADRLAAAYARAVRSASGSETVGAPGARTRLLTELADAGAAYAALAAAARADDAGGYADARGLIGAAERRVDAAIAELALTARD